MSILKNFKSEKKLFKKKKIVTDNFVEKKISSKIPPKFCSIISANTGKTSTKILKNHFIYGTSTTNI